MIEILKNKKNCLTCKGCLRSWGFLLTWKMPLYWHFMDQSYVKTMKEKKRQRPPLHPATMIPGQCFITFHVLILNRDYILYIRSTSLKALKNQHWWRFYLNSKQIGIVWPSCAQSCDIFKAHRSSTISSVLLTNNSLLILNLRWRKQILADSQTQRPSEAKWSLQKTEQ